MLTLQSHQGPQFCGGMSRRDFLRVGAVSAGGICLSLADLNQVQAAGGKSGDINCILLFLIGAPSQLDTWDMKPDAPSEIRSQYRAISTNIPGRHVSEHLPGCAKIMDKIAIVPSMHHDMANHNSAMYQALVGRAPSRDFDILGANRVSDFPNHGSALSYLTAKGELPRGTHPLTHVALPHVLWNVVDLPGQNAGFLGGGYDPLQIVGNPHLPAFQVKNLQPPTGVTPARLAARQSLLGSLDRGLENPEAGSLEAHQERAFELIRDTKIQEAFQVDRETVKTRDRYGRHRLGQSLLLARRLVEGGVRFVNVHDGMQNGQNANWDSHATIFPRHQQLLTPMDQGFSTLVEDLDQRGLLDSTLVIAMGEFGRTPRINKAGGRDHWPACYSIAMAGGGVARDGAVFGSSDRQAAYPESHPVTPGDLAATVFWRFGIDPRREIRDAFGRPFPLADGTPMRALFPGAV